MHTQAQPTHAFQPKFAWFFLFFALGCREETEFIPTQGTQLIALEYYCEKGECSTSYSYNTDGQLIAVHRDIGVSYELEYQGNQLLQYSIMSTEAKTLISRDSLLYNNEGLLIAIHEFDPDIGDGLVPATISEFTYDQNGRLSETRLFFTRFRTLIRSERFYWEGENIVREEHFDNQGNLKGEFFYAYDDKFNPFRHLPDYLKMPLNWSLNNIVSFSWNDYGSGIELDCNPCQISYEYNSDHYPVRIIPDIGDTKSWVRNTSVLQYQHP